MALELATEQEQVPELGQEQVLELVQVWATERVLAQGSVQVLELAQEPAREQEPEMVLALAPALEPEQAQELARVPELEQDLATGLVAVLGKCIMYWNELLHYFLLRLSYIRHQH